MDAATIDRLIKLFALGQTAFQEALKLIENHATQSGKTPTELLDRSEEHTKAALEIVNNL